MVFVYLNAYLPAVGGSLNKRGCWKHYKKLLNGGVGISWGGGKNALKSKILLLSSTLVRKSGAYGHENVSSTKILLKYKKICSKLLLGTCVEKLLRKKQ